MIYPSYYLLFLGLTAILHHVIIQQINKDNNMVNTYSTSMEKVTFNMSSELKEQVMVLKDELNISLSSIYNEAIANYLKQKELDKWHKGVSLALQDKEYIALSKELGSDNGELYEY